MHNPYAASAYLPPGAPADYVDPWLEIDTTRLRHNLAQVRTKTGSTPIMAIVKGNAYGHGAVGIALELAKLGINRFAVAKVAEGVALREAGLDGMILNLSPFSHMEATQLVSHGIHQSVYTQPQLATLTTAAQAAGSIVPVHIKIDTGLSRVGVPFREAVPFIEDVAGAGRIADRGPVYHPC